MFSSHSLKVIKNCIMGLKVTFKSSSRAQASNTFSYLGLLYCLPNSIFSLTVACCIQGSWLTRANPTSRSLTLTWPLTLCISAIILLRMELLPEPTLPMIPINCPCEINDSFERFYRTRPCYFRLNVKIFVKVKGKWEIAGKKQKHLFQQDFPYSWSILPIKYRLFSFCKWW